MPLLPFASAPSRHRPTWSVFVRGILRATAWLVISLWSLVLLGWLTLHWGILPHINEWRGRIEQQATLALGAPVHIGRIEVRSSGWVPVFELQDVFLQDAQGRVALRLPRVSAALAPQTLLALQLRFAQLHLRDVQLVVRRDVAGRLHVGGLDLPEQASVDGGGAADWFFAQHEFVIENGQLLWIDEASGAPPLALRQVQMVVRNGLRRHDWRLDATPPETLGERFSLMGRFTQPLLARSGDVRRWSGTVFAHLPLVDAAALREQLKLPADLGGGVGALRGWLDLERGQWRRAVADSAWSGLHLRLASDLSPLAFNRISGRLTAQRGATGMTLAAQDLAFQTAEGTTWPASQWHLAWQSPQAGTRMAWSDLTGGRGGEFSVDRLDLAHLASLVERLPLPAELHARLAALAPQGVVQGLRAQWTGALAQPSHYRLQGRVTGLAVAPGTPSQPGAMARPGWRHADLTLDANETGGQAQLSLRQGALLLPGLFADPEVMLDHFSSTLMWTLRRPAGAGADAPPDIELQLRDGRFANADAQGELQLRWRTGAQGDKGSAGPRFPGVIDLSGSLRQARATAVARYLPLGVGASVREYVAAAVRDGQVPRASFKVRGDLRDFPFAQRQNGEFHVAVQITRGVLAYVPDAEAMAAGREPPWPPFSEVQGELVFDRGGMEIHNAQARLWGIALQHVNGAIRDLVQHPTLSLEGAGRGPLNDALRFMGATPVGTWTRHALGQSAGTGNAELKLRLDIPLDDLDHTRVDGAVVLAGNDVRLRPDMPLLAGARARVAFTHQGFSIHGGSARVLGGEASIEGGSHADGSVRIRAQGTASAEGLRQASELGPATRLANLLSGQAPYQFQLGFARGQTEYSLRSPLTGMALDLPAPLHKNAADTWPLLVQASLADDGAVNASRDTLRVELGSQVQAEWQRDLAGPSPRVLRGAMGLGVAMPALPSSGVAAAAALGAINLDAWTATLRRLSGPDGLVTVLAKPAEVAAVTDATGAYLPDQVQIKAQSLAWQGRALTQVQARLQRRGGESALTGLHASLQADQAQGEADWQPGASPQAPSRVMLHLSRLALPLAEAPRTDLPSTTAAAAQAPGPATPHPTLDIMVDALDWRQHPLGKLELAASGTAREWRIAKLSLAHADATLSGSGLWVALPAPHMNLDLDLQLADSGALLEHLGMGKVLRHGSGQIKAQLHWPGSPLEPSLAAVSGRAQIALDSGQVLQVEPGAARLLGILSLQALPRRLTLDFRDVFQQGLVFDHISGDLRLAGGVARTNNLRVRSVQAVVLMEGQSDLRRETQDLHVVVVPEINAGTASLAYAAINPAIGLGTFLAQYLLRGPLQQAGTREFHITGTWDQPITDAVERAADAPRPDVDGPASAPMGAASAHGNNPR